MKKYKFTGKTKIVNGVELKQIIRLRGSIIGGWIEKEENLSQEGDCFVYDNSIIFGNAKVYEDAEVHADYSTRINAVGSNIKTSKPI